jgi:SAM-dependent methyltransferase
VDGSLNARLQQHPRTKAVLGRLGVLPRQQAGLPWASGIVIHDLRKPLPWDDGQFEAVYASHLLEHLTWGDAGQLLREARRVLAPGGVCRIVVPDLQFFISEYQSRTSEPYVPGFFPEDATVTNADAFIQNLGFASPVSRAGGIAIRIYSKLFDYHHHKWMYDEQGLAAQMRAAGFVDVRRRDYNDSQIPNIHEVELEERVVPLGLACEGTAPSGT